MSPIFSVCTWNDLSKLCHTQLRWMSSTTAAPGRKKGALARLLVCTLTYTPAPLTAASCSWKLVDSLNSATRTFPNSRSRSRNMFSLRMRRLARLRWYRMVRGTGAGSGGARSYCWYRAARKAWASGVEWKVRVPPVNRSLTTRALSNTTHSSGPNPSSGDTVCNMISGCSCCMMTGGNDACGATPSVTAITARTHSMRCARFRCSSTNCAGGFAKLGCSRRMEYSGNIISHQCPIAVGCKK
mmetsp:Transcript_10956/g.32834  ORF Transcript_10956/g.32834 Transcript_10956/m.32834 type:complete len:242 (+) Transcript_10956:528-1253(+)